MRTRKPKPKLSEADWRRIFEIRCRSKSGRGISTDELALCKRAIEADSKRYSAMDRGIFEATKPFGAG